MGRGKCVWGGGGFGGPHPEGGAFETRGRAAIKAEDVRQLVLPGVRTESGFQKSTVSIACPRPRGKNIFSG